MLIRLENQENISQNPSVTQFVVVLDIFSDMRHYCWQLHPKNNNQKQAGYSVGVSRQKCRQKCWR